MRVAHLVIIISAFVAACGGKPGQSVCDNQVPPPAACMTTCDPKPGAPNTCPSGYHCAADGFCDALCTPGGGECGDGYVCTSDGRCKGENECTGLECNIVDCTGKPGDTTIKGTVYAPNGTLPLYGITVYVPNAALPPMVEGAQCSRCNEDLPGSPLVRATTDEKGEFTITGAPAGANIPLVITSGKWRRQIVIPNINSCADNALPGTETRLPKNKAEGDIPKIAITNGNADSLECLIRKMGVDDAEITASGGAGRVHLYRGNGTANFKGGFPGGSGAIPTATTFWNNVDNLKPYDIVILSCEGGQNPQTKPQATLDAMEAYANLGGRVFASHWHNIWIAGADNSGGNQAVASWLPVAQWNYGGDPGLTDVIDEVNNPKGSSFATWMLNVMGSTTRGLITLQGGTDRGTCQSVDLARAERWVYAQSDMQPQNFQFTTPQNVPADQRCGKVVFSDMHVSGGPTPGVDYPDSCGNNGTIQPLTAQEKALAFMLFDLASCVGVLL